jgi:hypothetical protein
VNNNNTKMGVQWDFLAMLKDFYGDALTAKSIYLQAKNGRYRNDYGDLINPIEAYANCRAQLDRFYTPVKHNIAQWLQSSKNTQLTTEDIEQWIEDEEGKLTQYTNQVYRVIGEWAGTKGPFATLVEDNDYATQEEKDIADGV